VTEIQSFLGLTGYYRHFILGFSLLALPMTQLLQKEAKFEWTLEQQHSFKELQGQLVSAPILRMLVQDVEYTMFTDAFRFRLGCILMQEGHVIAYASR
jgi:RNase H-like domain found in reverse transcriptase